MLKNANRLETLTLYMYMLSVNDFNLLLLRAWTTPTVVIKITKEQQKNLISNALILIGMSLIFVGLIKPVKPYGATTTTTTSNEENLILFFEILILAEKEKAKEKQRGRENR
uniref:Uncharacterized protein n=1 Tax=Glossina pallidipes TaxID=7398 RepID=A0A1A9ZU99_GLOPL